MMQLTLYNQLFSGQVDLFQFSDEQTTTLIFLVSTVNILKEFFENIIQHVIFQSFLLLYLINQSNYNKVLQNLSTNNSTLKSIISSLVGARKEKDLFMEGWISIKRGWFWSQRYGFISPGEFKYFDDQSMSKLKRSFKLKDFQIVQNRAEKVIKLVQDNKEQLQIKSDLHELWYTKLIQSKVSSMNIQYIPQQQAQELIRRNSQNPNIQQLEQQNINPNSVVNPLDISNMGMNRNQVHQRIIQQPANQQNNVQQQYRNNQNIIQQQVVPQYPSYPSNSQQYQQQQLQIAQQLALQQRLAQQNHMVQHRNVAPQQNNLNVQAQQRQVGVPNQQLQQQQQQPKPETEKRGIFGKIKDLFVGKKEDYYDENFVKELNSNISNKTAVKEKIEEIILGITSQPDLFEFEKYSNTIQYNLMQQQQLQKVFEEKRNILPIRIFFSIFLMFIILFNAINWQRYQLIYTFCSMIIILLCVFYKYIKSKQLASKCYVYAFTQQPIKVNKSYTLNELLSKLKQANKNLHIFEQEKNKELFILDRNQRFQAVYHLQIQSSTQMDIKVYTKNYEFLDSIIENFSTNYRDKFGIWNENPRKSPNQSNVILEIFNQKIVQYEAKYERYKEETREPLYKELYVLFQIIKNNWELSYEIFALLCLLIRIRDQIEDNFDWMLVSHWFLIINYGFTFTKLTFSFENIFLNLRDEIKKQERLIDKVRNTYFQKDIYKITFNQNEIFIQEKISDIEVWFVGSSLFASIVFRDWQRVLQVIFLPILKKTSLQRYDQLKKIIITVPSVLVLSVVGILAGIFFGAMFVIYFILKQLKNIFFFMLRGCKTRQQATSNNQNQVQIQFFEASSIQNYQEQECSICLENYTSARELVFRCKNKHFYHKDCIIKWITSGNFSATRKCPICRVDLLS